MSDSPGSAPTPSAPPPSAPVAEPKAEAPKEGAPPVEGEKKPRTPPPPPPTPKMRKVMIDGEEHEVDEDQVFRDYQKYKSGDKALKEVAEQKKEVAEQKKQFAEFWKALKENPRKVLANPKLGLDLRKIAEEHLMEEIKADMEDPRDVRLRELEAEKKARDDKDTDERTSKEQQEYEGHVAAQREEISGKLGEVLKSTVLAKDAMTLRGAAYYMRQCLLQKVDVTPEQIVEHLENTHLPNLRATALQYSGEQLVDYLGPELTKKLREHDLAELRKARGVKNEAKVRQDAPEPSSKTKATQYFDRHSMAEMARKKLLGN